MGNADVPLGTFSLRPRFPNLERKMQALRNTLYSNWASLVVLVVKNLPTNAGDIRDMGSISGLGKSPEEARKPTAVFLPGETMDREAW